MTQMKQIIAMLNFIRSIPARKKSSIETAIGAFRLPRDAPAQGTHALVSLSLERGRQQAKTPMRAGDGWLSAAFYSCPDVWQPRATAAAVHRPYRQGAIGCRSRLMSGTGS